MFTNTPSSPHISSSSKDSFLWPRPFLSSSRCPRAGEDGEVRPFGGPAQLSFWLSLDSPCWRAWHTPILPSFPRPTPRSPGWSLWGRGRVFLVTQGWPSRIILFLFLTGRSLLILPSSLPPPFLLFFPSLHPCLPYFLIMLSWTEYLIWNQTTWVQIPLLSPWAN